MQKYKSNITTTSGAAVRGVPVLVIKEDGNNAALFLDRAGTVQAPNPLTTGADGTFYFYAINGRYSLRTAVEGVTITDADVVLLWDPAEVLLSGPLAEAVERAEASAAQAEAAVADSGIVDLVASAQNAVVDAQLALAEASGLGQAAQEAEDAAASAVLASQVATDAANLAVDAAQDAILASAATIKAYATHAGAAIAAALLPDGADVEVSQDETRAGARTRYKVQAGALVFVVNLDQTKIDLAAATGASQVGFQQEGAGAVATTVHAKLRGFVSIKDFGAVGDGVVRALSERFSTLAMAQVAYPHATSLTQSIDWAATQAAINSGASRIHAPSGHYMMTDTVRIPFGVTLDCDGVDYWDSWRPNREELIKSAAKGTHWYFVGTGAKSFACDDLANVLPIKTVAGIQYPFTRFTLEDSVAGSPATPRPFSVAFIVERNAGLRNCRVIPSYNKLQGYIDGTGLSDEWDVGVWTLSANDCDVYNVQSVGHWRMGGVLYTEHYDSAQGPRNPERIGLRRVWGAGVRGLIARNTPQYKVTAWTASSVTVEWMPSFTLTRVQKFRIGPVLHNYTGYTFDSATNTVTLTGVTPSITSAPSALRAWNMGNNLSNTILQDCVFSSLDHATGQPSESFGLPVSGAAEYDGFPLRNIVHVNTAFQTTYDKLNTLWGGSYDFKYVACKHENGELIAYSNTEHPHNTMNLRFVGEDGPIDATKLAEFNPRSAWVDSYQVPQTFTDGTLIFKPLPKRAFRLLNHAGQTVVDVSGTSNAFSYFTNGNGYGSQITGANNVTMRSGNNFIVTNNGVESFRADGVSVSISAVSYFAGIGRPTVDSSFSWGSGPNRWSTLFAATGTINTSDEREKSQPLPIDESVIDAWGDVQLIAFQWLDSIQKKGEDGSRWHFGVIAQRVRDAFAARGLDGTRYGLLCYDEWIDRFEDVVATRDIVEMQETSEGVWEEVAVGEEEYKTGEVRLVQAAGNRWGIRADQCLFLEAAYQRREMQRLRARLGALENQTGPTPVSK